MRWTIPTRSEKHSRHFLDFRLDVLEHSIVDPMNQVIAPELPIALRLDFNFMILGGLGALVGGGFGRALPIAHGKVVYKR